MSITHITSLSQLDGVLSKSSGKLSVIDFHAEWCGPCHMIAPTFEALSKQYKNVNFLKCDVDAAKDVASRYRVTAMPTFVFLKGSTKVDQVRGANPGALQETLRRHASDSPSGAFSGKGQRLGDAPSPAPSTVEAQTDAPAIFNAFTQLDPKVKVLIYLAAGYLFFMYFS
ncbi:thioredoxin-domain-containing protein [Daedalea quercina L-15889]|uniref:Thioredoxin n=1 Tax=Daedalea quercina L-15889 TaxID=1314783 RepID=A0A165UI95_9APHY|nr:thioredoxin-domain-containing protein [Daedalea quercina L-15889]